MSMRHFKAALLVVSALLLAPQTFWAQRNSSSSRSTYTPPPPRPAPVYTPRPSNSNVRSPGQTPQASNNNSVRPTPRTTVTPRNPQPRTTPSSLTRTPANGNNRAQQIANQNNRNRQIANNNLKQQQQKQLQQRQLQQKQLFLKKQQEAKLSAQKQADAKARLARLRASNTPPGGGPNASGGGPYRPPTPANDDKRPVIGKQPHLDTPGTVRAGERQLDLPKLNNEDAQRAQNIHKLSQEMAIGKPIRDVSTGPVVNGKPGNNTGYLKMERDLLYGKGWRLKDGYWNPPAR